MEWTSSVAPESLESTAVYSNFLAPVFHLNGSGERVVLGIGEHSVAAIHLHLVCAGSELQGSNLGGLGQIDIISFACRKSEAGKS